MQNVAELVFGNPVDDGDLFLSSASFSCTYGQARRLVSSAATALLKLKEKAQVSAVIVPAISDPRTVLCFFALAYAGIAYAPISPSSNPEYASDAASMVNAEFSISIGGTRLNVELPQLDFEELIACDPAFPTLEEAKKSWCADSILYYVFTSGSTGKPKCIAKSNKSVLSFVLNFLQTIPLSKGSRLANQTPLFFDASAKDIYLTPAVGGALFFPDRTLFALPAKLIDYLNENAITSIFWVPSALTIIAKTRTLNYVKPTTLKNVFFVGEVFQPKFLNMWIDALPNVSFYNLYGSSETAGIVLYYRVDHRLSESESLPIGRPLANVTCHLEDGELCIQSDQVASGYVGNPDENARTFVKDNNGLTTLHTGDYAVYENGLYFFTTRKDFQIKHMGYRVELQGIEAHLQTIDYIDACCCVYDQINNRIVAFVTVGKGAEVLPARIIQDTKGIMPSYCVPNRVVILPEMPLSPNGKMDRQELKKKLGGG